jgi:nicotinamidase-related amidase
MGPLLAELVTAGHCALLVQEVQEGVVGPRAGLKELAAAASSVDLIARLCELTAAARRGGVPVLHCTAADLPDSFGSNSNARLFTAARRIGTIALPGDPSVQPTGGLLVEGDIVIPRFHGLSPLTGSQLDSLLRNEGIRTVVVTGVSLNVAIPNLVFDAINRSYQVVVPRDAVVGVPIDYGEMVIEHTLRPLATICTVPELVTLWGGAEP